MSRRKLFEIDLPPEDEGPAAAPQGQGAPETKSGPPHNRGPMASAVRDTARSLRERAEIEAGIRAENDALAAELVRLRAEGLAVERIPLDLIDTQKLVRDRRAGPEAQVEDLKRSLLDVGLSNPIRVERSGERYELIQGWRRLQAFRALLEETEAPEWAAIPAAIDPEGGDLDTAYRRMVDENLVREDISFAEMAELARRYFADPRTGREGGRGAVPPARSAEDAVPILFLSASPQKRSYIRAFVQLLEAVGDALQHPQAIPRALGLDLRRVLAETGEAGAQMLRQGLARVPERGPEAELDILRMFVRHAAEGSAAVLPAEGRGARPGPAPEAPDGAGPAPAIVPGLARQGGAPDGRGARPTAHPTSRAAARAADGQGAPGPSGRGAGPVEVSVPLAGTPGADGGAGALRCSLRDGRVQLSGPLAAPDVDEDRLRRAALAFYAALME